MHRWQAYFRYWCAVIFSYVLDLPKLIVYHFRLEECGPTALGPALLVASTVASRVRGSKVILCTDGLANVGMGKLDNFKSEEEEEASLNFYEEIANCAADDG